MAKTYREIPNETHLAAELAESGIRASMAAHYAYELCRLGRSYKRVAEKLCGGEEEWGPWSDKVEKTMARAHEQQETRVSSANLMLIGSKAKVYVSTGSGLLLMCEVGIHKTALL